MLVLTAEKSLKDRIWSLLRVQRALRIVWESSRGWTIAGTILLAVQGVLPLASLYLIKLIVDAIATAFAAADKAGSFLNVAVLVGYAGAIALVGAFLESISELAGEAQGHMVTDHVQDMLHAKSLEVDLEYYENARYYDTLHRAQQEAPYRPTLILNDLLEIGRSSISLLAIAVLLAFSLHWGFVLILIAAVVPGMLIRLKYADKMYRWQRERTATERRVDYINWVLTGDWHAKEIRMFSLGSLFKGRSQKLRKRLREEKLRIVTRRAFIQLIAQASQVLAVFGSFAMIAYRTVQGAITVGDLIMFFQAFQRAHAYLQDIMGSLADLYENNLFLSNLYEFLGIKPKIVDPSNSKPFQNPIRTGIVLNHVSFRYPNAARKALEDINLVIMPGEVVAVVGENGAGKTTLLKLLCRLYDPTNGSITVDGTDLRQFSIADLRRHIAVIFQDFAKYQLSARENIWLGNTTLAPKHDGILEAAIHSGADGFIRQLPKGYDTMLGKWFEEGEELSYGEWQKVALSRTLFRDSQITILDEPTSNLDVRTENELIQRFRELASDRTVILISHRLSTVKMADRIYVMDNGEIVESGTHDELARQDEAYKRLFKLQAQHYC